MVNVWPKRLPCFYSVNSVYCFHLACDFLMFESVLTFFKVFYIQLMKQFLFKMFIIIIIIIIVVVAKYMCIYYYNFLLLLIIIYLLSD